MQKCDGVPNCPNGEDEENCPTNEVEPVEEDEDDLSGGGEIDEPKVEETEIEVDQDQNQPDEKIGDFFIIWKLFLCFFFQFLEHL